MVDDELNQNQEYVPEGEEVEENETARLAELEGVIAEKDEELTKANSRITGLEQAVAELDKNFKATDSAMAEAIASYKAIVVQANREVPEELISGDGVSPFPFDGTILTYQGYVNIATEREFIS